MTLAVPCVHHAVAIFAAQQPSVFSDDEALTMSPAAAADGVIVACASRDGRAWSRARHLPYRCRLDHVHHAGISQLTSTDAGKNCVVVLTRTRRKVYSLEMRWAVENEEGGGGRQPRAALWKVRHLRGENSDYWPFALQCVSVSLYLFK